MQTAAIGFAPHSGWAAMIALGLTPSGPCILARSRVQLIDIKRQTEELKARGFRVQRAGILESGGRKPSSLSSILASHALIHAADGDHFRNALWAAAEQCGLEVHRVQARILEKQGAASLDVLNALGKKMGPPWGADQKKAALLAWSLCQRPLIAPAS
jgi:hypothetical protein